MAESAPPKRPTGWLSWVVAVAGWLICAGFCLWLTIALEAWPYAYEVFFPAILLILFCNILVFLFVATRWASQTRRLFGAVARVCVGEGLLLLLMYAAGRYGIGG
ncbi:MAG: hypothetical protein HDQ90_03900 [Desulfovibrio sp.]|nr:hypothetical protein [Desulfovibrio sp.]